MSEENSFSKIICFQQKYRDLYLIHKTSTKISQAMVLDSSSASSDKEKNQCEYKLDVMIVGQKN